MADPDTIKRNTDATDPLIQRFAAWDKRLDNHWSDWRKETRTNFDMVAGRQWAADDETELEEKDRLAPVFNKLAPLIDAVSGAEIAGRQQVNYYPREAGDSAVNELLTKGADWIRDRCDADMEESEAFRNVFICGIGVTETAMDYDEDPDGQVVVRSVDPLEIAIDPSARRANAIDARFLRRRKPMSRDAYEEAFPDYAGLSAEASPQSFGALHVNNPSRRYEGDISDLDVEGADPDEILVDEYQWFETEPFYVIADPETGQRLHASEEDFQALQAEFAAFGGEVDGVRLRRRRYYRAFVCGAQVLGDVEELADGEFTYKIVTGKRDRNKRVWYGLVRAMVDPQKWLNQFLSQLIAILASSTKAGAFAETDAIPDWNQFEESFSKIGGITKLRPGALSGNKVKEKTVGAFPAGLDRLMGLTTDALRETSGINPEMLGMVDRDQAGVLEYQRKQAAYGILACYFDSFRRYRRIQGRLMLKVFRYLPQDYLVRLTDPKSGLAKYVPFAVDPEVQKFDVIVDEAPAGPNQKAQVWNMIVQLMPFLKDADLPASFWADVARYSPFPNELAVSLQQSLTASEQQPDPNAERLAAAQVAGAEADVRATAAKADKDTADAAATRAAAINDMAGAALARAEAGVMFPPDQSAFGEVGQ